MYGSFLSTKSIPYQLSQSYMAAELIDITVSILCNDSRSCGCVVRISWTPCPIPTGVGGVVGRKEEFNERLGW